MCVSECECVCGQGNIYQIGYIYIIHTHTLVHTLKLEWNEITHRGAQLLGEFLMENSTLHSLDLYGCRIRDNGTKALAIALSTNTALTYRTYFLLYLSFSFLYIYIYITLQCYIVSSRSVQLWDKR